MIATVPLEGTTRPVRQDAFRVKRGSPVRGLIRRICDSDDAALDDAETPQHMDTVWAPKLILDMLNRR
jgi:hypothetical protein